MLNNLARIKSASVVTHARARMIQKEAQEMLDDSWGKFMKCLVLRGDWCLGPESNRHARSLVTQDFKSCIKIQQRRDIIGFHSQIHSKSASKTHQSMRRHVPTYSYFHILTLQFLSPTKQAGGPAYAFSISSKNI